MKMGRFWAEGDTVGVPMKCGPYLSCVVVTHPETQNQYHACCYIGSNSYRKSLTFADYHMCEMSDTNDDGYEDATATIDPILMYQYEEGEGEPNSTIENGTGGLIASRISTKDMIIRLHLALFLSFNYLF